jgi:hypothetical protein
VKFGISVFCRKSFLTIQVSSTSANNNRYLTWSRPIHNLALSRSVLLEMRNVSNKTCRDNQNTHLISMNIFLKSCRLWERWKYFVKPGRPQMRIRRMRLACRITKATDTHSKYVILIAFPLQKWLYGVPQCNVIRTLPVVFINQCSLLLLKILKYNYRDQERNRLFHHNLSKPASCIILFCICNYLWNQIPTNKFLLSHIFTLNHLPVP